MKPELRAKIILMICRLDSNFDAEVLTTARTIVRTLKQNGLTLADLKNELTGPPAPQPPPSVKEHRTPADAPRRPVMSDSERFVSSCDAILEQDDSMGDHEIIFVKEMRARAKIRKAVHMTVRQSEWFERLLQRYGRED